MVPYVGLRDGPVTFVKGGVTAMNIPDLRTLALPNQLLYKGRDLTPHLLRFVDITVNAWTATDQLSAKKGYGLASTNVLPAGTLHSNDGEDPRTLLGFGIAAHGAETYYPWNALRKMRMLA